MATMIMVLAYATAGRAHEPDAPATEGAAPAPLGIGFATVAQARAAQLALPEIEVSEVEGWLVVVLPAEREQWRFTPQGHRAHPAVVRRQLAGGHADATMRMAILCEAGRKACDALEREFERENAAIVAHEHEHAHDGEVHRP